jgi:hypothetical protein
MMPGIRFLTNLQYLSQHKNRVYDQVSNAKGERGMRRSWAVLLALTVLTTPLFAQSESNTESMTEEQLEAFNQGILIVDVGLTSTFTGGFAWSLETYNRWKGFQGFARLSESQFYAIAGYPAEAQKAAAYRSVGWGLAIGGGAMVVGGLLWMMLGVTADTYDPNWETKANWALYGGTVLSLGGVIPMWIGSSRLRKNWSSVEQAKIVADKYNRKLADKIRGD